MSTSDAEDLRTLEADLRTALQHQHAEYERIRELQREVEALMETARALIAAKEAAAAAGDVEAGADQAE